jgi:D-amino-acid dehydrogenase
MSSAVGAVGGHRLRHAVVIGQGVVGCTTAIEAIRAGMRVTIVDPEAAGGEHATSYGNSGWLSSHSVVPPALPGAWRKVPGWLLDPLGPLAVRWPHLPRALPWLLR